MTSRPTLALALPNQRTFGPKQSRLTPMSTAPKASGQLFPEIVTTQDLSGILPNPVDHASLRAGLVPRLRMLRAVVERLPRHFTPYKTAPQYKLTYYIEKLSCGHKRIYFPQTGPMAKRRHCAECSAVSSLPPRKSPQVVTEQTKEAAYGD